MKFNVKEWKGFRIDKIFDIYTGGDLIMGEIEEGDIPIASNSSENNNIAAYTALIPNRKLFDHTKSISIADRGKFWAFIQPKDFYLATRVKGLVCKNNNILNEYQLAFIVSIINRESFKFSYGRNCCAHLPDIEIFLPIQKNENGTPIIDNKQTYTSEGYLPDWQFMEDYIKSLRHKPLTTKNKQGHAPDLNVQDWKEFKIKDFFKVELAKGDIKLDEVDEGDIPLVSSGESNNGIVGYIDRAGDGKSEIFPANRITIDMFGNAFYQNEPFYAVSHGRVNILKPKFDLTRNIGLFMSAIIKQEQYKFSYGRAVYSGVAENMDIVLPINTDGKPNWQFMEDYIKSLPYGDRI